MRAAKKLFYFCLLLAALFAVFTTTKAALIVETTAKPVSNVGPSQDETACTFCPPKITTTKPLKQCEAGRKYDTRQGRCVRLPK